MGGCSFSIYDILIQPKSGWFKLLDLDKAEYRCVPVLEEKNVLCSKDDENEESTREGLNSETKDATLGEIDVELDTEISKDVSDSPCPEMADIKSKEGEQETNDENSNTRLDNYDPFTGNSREGLNIETEDATIGEIDVRLDTEISKDVSDGPEIADIKNKEGDQETDVDNSNTKLDNNDAFTANTVKYDSRKFKFRFGKTGPNLNNVVFDDISKQLPDTDTGK